ncbi:S1 RNA-binding domain-containing protein [Desulfovibrio litoralis]|uniref:SSU ribosomal protein S1P n=1 Tax=Desulfovibrio litoralis DSM 11393 TaxID=1121455 RepID=A0A1M7SX12_9BACT|nr:S1 RNA-binding domain-containing protein [Desulfovibrio litoralis]SHN63009.1 SSU ribosomal protein S1P [Desulfovibrio litoralis DSM 11393]
MSGEETGIVETESFADLLDAHSKATENLRQGMRVKCTVVAITVDTIFVSTGDKVDGIVERKEFEDAGGNPSCSVGDELELYVTVANAHEVRLSKALAGSGGVSVLKDAQEAGLPVEGKVMAAVKGGYSVELMKRRTFCPFSQMDVKVIENPDSMIGQVFNFIVTKVEQGGRNITVSRRILLERENAANRELFLSKVNVGDVLEGEVVRLMPFGAFIELSPGVEGLVHISELSWSKVTQADEVLSLNDKIRVKLLSVKTEEKSVKISLSIRQITEDPWKTVEGRLELGQILSGKVRRLTSFGAFVEILPGIEGLVHLSEFSYERRIVKAEDMLNVGDIVSVKIKEFDLDKKRVSLSIKEAGGDPWADVETNFSVDSLVQATVEKREKFGLFIKLMPGVVGLLPNSVLSLAKKGVYDKLSSGDSIEVVIKNVDQAGRRISLSVPEENLTGVPVAFDNADSDKPQKTKHNNDRNTKPRGGRDFKREDKKDNSWKEHAQTKDSFGGSLGLAFQVALNKKK